MEKRRYLVHHNVGLASLLQAANGLSAAANDTAYNTSWAGNRLRNFAAAGRGVRPHEALDFLDGRLHALRSRSRYGHLLRVSNCVVINLRRYGRVLVGD